MAEAPKTESFEEIVDWAYNTLPPNARACLIFPAFKWPKSLR